MRSLQLIQGIAGDGSLPIYRQTRFEKVGDFPKKWQKKGGGRLIFLNLGMLDPEIL
jgi:hypothetical protein